MFLHQTKVSTYQYATNRSPDHFTDPDSFHPERWLPKTHPLYDPKYINDNLGVVKPFSYGSRDCLGKNLAYAEMHLFASRLLYRFDAQLEPGQESWQQNQSAYIVWSKPPLYIKLHKRDIS